jgi:hypothetical protein
MTAAKEIIEIPLAEYEALKAGTVTISLAEYAELKTCAADLATLKFKPAGQSIKRKNFHESKVSRDPEIEAFVRDRLACYTITEVAEACLLKFGKSRSPSKSSIHRFLQSKNTV